MYTIVSVYGNEFGQKLSECVTDCWSSCTWL